MNAFGGRASHAILSAMPDQLGARSAIGKGISVDFPMEGRVPALHGKPSPVRYLALARYMQNFDLVLTYNWGAMDAVMAHRLLSPFMRLPPLIHHEDGFNADESKRLDWRRNAFRRAALQTARAIVVPSYRLEAIAREIWKGGTRVRRISNGIVVASYLAEPEPGGIPIFTRRPRDVVVGTVAGLRQVKDLPLLVRAMALCPRTVRLVIVGEGPERETIAQAAVAAGVADRVSLVGFHANPAQYVGSFDILALSSLSEQQPIAVMEGMAAGLPRVAPPVGDIAQMVSARNAPFVVERDAEALGSAITTLAGNKRLRTAIGADNRLRAAQLFDDATMVASYDALYADALGQPAGALSGITLI